MMLNSRPVPQDKPSRQPHLATTPTSPTNAIQGASQYCRKQLKIGGESIFHPHIAILSLLKMLHAPQFNPSRKGRVYCSLTSPVKIGGAHTYAFDVSRSPPQFLSAAQTSSPRLPPSRRRSPPLAKAGAPRGARTAIPRQRDIPPRRQSPLLTLAHAWSDRQTTGTDGAGG
jgi:hypothetical protein